jgi:hypothetical protein
MESMTGTCEAKVAEYPTAAIVNWRIPLKLNGMAKDKAINNPPNATRILFKPAFFPFIRAPPSLQWIDTRICLSKF